SRDKKKNERNGGLLVMSPQHHAIRGEGIMHTPRAEIVAFNGQPDTRLIKAIASGNPSALRTFYLRHNIRVFRFISRLVAARALAEDLVSDVFIEVWSKAGSFEGRSHVSTWLLAIARLKPCRHSIASARFLATSRHWNSSRIRLTRRK